MQPRGDLATYGDASHAIARELRLDIKTVRLWRRRFARRHKLAALDDAPRSGRPPRPGREGRKEFEYIRHGTRCLLAAFDVRTGKVFGQVRKRRTAKDLAAFMEAVARRYPTGDVYIIWDNLNTHCGEAWEKFNQRHGGRFHFVYTPKHASWVNQVEIWFSLLHRRILKYGDFSTAEQMVSSVTGFIRHWNRVEAHPFRWTFRGRFTQHRAAA